jgi:hypothetical protein
MAKKVDVGIQHLIIDGKLVKEKSFDSLVNKISIYTIFMLAVIVPIYFFSQVNRHNANDRFITISILLPTFCFGVYGLFRKSQEDRAYQFDIKLPREEIRKMIEAFLNMKGYSIVSKAKSIIFSKRQSELGYSNLWTYDLTFVFTDEEIWMNISKQTLGLNWPVFFMQYFIKRDLERFFKTYMKN